MKLSSVLLSLLLAPAAQGGKEGKNRMKNECLRGSALTYGPERSKISIIIICLTRANPEADNYLTLLVCPH
jgi:hypothetical protein